MRIYFDCCSLQRLFDDRSQPRVAVEAEAVLVVLGMCEAGGVELISSEPLHLEIALIPDEGRRKNALAILGLASQFVQVTTEVEALARRLGEQGIKPLDALHLACASSVRADYFCTCDDRLMRKAKAMTGLDTRVVLPVELVMELDR